MVERAHYIDWRKAALSKGNLTGELPKNWPVCVAVIDGTTVYVQGTHKKVVREVLREGILNLDVIDSVGPCQRVSYFKRSIEAIGELKEEPQ